MESLTSLRTSMKEFQAFSMGQMQQTENVLAILQKRESRIDSLVQENREDIAQSRNQLHELVQGMTRLSEDI